MNIPPLYKHQEATIEFLNEQPHVLNHSDPGTGKTRAWLEWFRQHRESGGGRGLVLCPKSIMEAAWEADAKEYTPEIKVSVASAEKRRDRLQSEADLYIINHDAVRQLVKDHSLLPKNIDSFCIDESTAFKNPTSQRSKACRSFLRPFEHRCTMTGTPTPQGILDLWHQALITDHGRHLGENFYRFRSMTCTPERISPHLPHMKWVEKPGVKDAIADLLSDCTIRFKLEDVIDMPERVEYFIRYTLQPKHREEYELLLEDAFLLTERGVINPVHAAALRTKLLQILSGSVYGDDEMTHVSSKGRYELIVDLMEARNATLVAFNWTHQKNSILEEAKKRKLRVAAIDGSVKMETRTQIVRDFQNGKIDHVLAHPRTAGHGLTLTRGQSIIWSSPTDDAELYTQFNARIYRSGQTKRTEIIKIIAEDTIEQRAYDNLDTKVSATQAFLELIKR